MRLLISVIIPAYNEEKYIHRALSSIKSQSFKDYEVIVVADSCTDRTAEIAKGYGCRVIKVKTRNLGKNQNIGASKAKANILVFLFADTRVTNRYLEEIYHAVKNGFSRGRPIYFHDSKNPLIMNLHLFENLLKTQHYPHTYFITKECFNQVNGYSEHFNNCMEDIDFAGRINKFNSTYKGCVLKSKAFNSDRRFKKRGWVKEVVFQTYYLFFYHIIYKILGIKIAPSYPVVR